jgi:hypothetical protein
MTQLLVSFTGLCLFVPDPDNLAGPRLHVLMPRDNQYKHKAHLYQAKTWPAKSKADLECLDLDGGVVDFSSICGTLSTCLHPDIADAARYYDAKAGRKEAKLHARARLTFRSGYMNCLQKGVRWKHPDGDVVNMAWWAQWMVDSVPSSLTIALRDPNHGNDLAPPLTVNANEEDTIHLYVYHVPEDQLPPNPQKARPARPDESPEHFHLFKTLFKNPQRDEVPGFAGDAVDVPTPCYRMFPPTRLGDESVQHVAESRGEEYTCMLARAQME